MAYIDYAAWLFCVLSWLIGLVGFTGFWFDCLTWLLVFVCFLVVSELLDGGGFGSIIVAAFLVLCDGMLVVWGCVGGLWWLCCNCWWVLWVCVWV